MTALVCMTKIPPLSRKDWYELNKAAIRIHQSPSLFSICETASAFLFQQRMIRAFRASLESGGSAPGKDLLVLPDDNEIPEYDRLKLPDFEFPLPNRDTLRIEVFLFPANSDQSPSIIDLIFQHLGVAAQKVPVFTLPRGPDPENVSPREKEVFPLLLAGKTNPEIAAILGISPRTVEKYVTGLLRKYECENRFALLAREYPKNT